MTFTAPAASRPFVAVSSSTADRYLVAPSETNVLSIGVVRAGPDGFSVDWQLPARSAEAR